MMMTMTGLDRGDLIVANLYLSQSRHRGITNLPMSHEDGVVVVVVVVVAPYSSS